MSDQVIIFVLPTNSLSFFPSLFLFLGHAIHKMTTGRSEVNKPTIVWCLDVTSDFTVISGDSRGKLTFWDGNLGAQIESYQSHLADILALAISEDESALCCAGVDPNIVNYEKICVKGKFVCYCKALYCSIILHFRRYTEVGKKHPEKNP